MKIAVGSLNPAKIAAVEAPIHRLWPGAAILPVDVLSGVPAMPFGDAQCIAGAQNRARAARRSVDADFGLGLEGGVSQEAVGLMLLGWVAVIDRQGTIGLASTARLPLPAQIAGRIVAGEELGPVIDDIVGRREVRQREGAVGVLTAGLVMRHETFALAVSYALAPFIAPEFYHPGSDGGRLP